MIAQEGIKEEARQDSDPSEAHSQTLFHIGGLIKNGGIVGGLAGLGEHTFVDCEGTL